MQVQEEHIPAVQEATMSSPAPQAENIASSGSVTENEEPREKQPPPADTADAAPSEEQPDSVEYVSGLRLLAMICSVTVVVFLMLLDTSIISTAIPRITDEFHSLPDVGWYGSAYQLASAALQPLTGKIYTHFNTKWTYLAFVFVFELGSLLCGTAVSSKMLIIGRAVAGMGSAGLYNGAMTIIVSSVPMSRRALLMGIMMGFSQLGVVCGPLVGGALTQSSTWRWCFYINLPFGAVVALFLFFVHIPDQIVKPPPLTVLSRLHHHLDLPGFVLFAPAPIMLLLALQYGGNQFAWNSATVIGLFCGSGGMFIVWSVWNWHRGDNALIPLSMVVKTSVWSSSLTQMFLLTTLFCASYFLPIYFQAVLGASPVMSGVYLLPGILSQLLFVVLSGVFITKTGYVVPYGVVAGALSAVGSGLFSLFSPTTPTGQWVGFQILASGGRGVGMQMPLMSIQTVLKPNEIPAATSLLMFAQSLGTAIFLVICNTIMDESLGTQLAAHAPAVNAEAIIALGATGFRAVVPPSELPGVILAYANSVDRVFYVACAAGVLSLITAFGMGWKDLRKVSKKPTAKAATDSTPDQAVVDKAVADTA